MVPNWVTELLDEHGVHYEHLHRPEGFAPNSLVTDEHGFRQSAAEVVVAVADGRLLELVVPADSWADLDKVRKLVGCHEIRLATEKELEQHYPDCAAGAVPPLRHAAGSDVLLDSWVDVNSSILFLGGSPRDVIRMPMEDWIELVNPRIASFSQPVLAPCGAE
jgi:Ala-tRNA(Pro) deacylase